MNLIVKSLLEGGEPSPELKEAMNKAWDFLLGAVVIIAIGLLATFIVD